MFVLTLPFICLNFLNNCRGVFSTTPNFSDEANCENSYHVKAVHYFHKTLHLIYMKLSIAFSSKEKTKNGEKVGVFHFVFKVRYS